MSMKMYCFGFTSLGSPIFAYEFGFGQRHTLILGGVHGDEIEGVFLANKLIENFAKAFPYRLKVTVVPSLNVDGVLFKTRGNASGVDLNRNLPTQDWTDQVANPRYYPGVKANSEPENRALVDWIIEKTPQFVLSLHSYLPMINVNGKALAEAEVLSNKTGYRIVDSIGYPTPGCLGTYTGLERNVPTITYELERGMKIEDIYRTHLPAILEMLKLQEEGPSN